MENDIDIKKRDRLMYFTFGSLALALVSTFTYMIYTLVVSGSFIDHVVSIIGVIALVGFSIFLVLAGFFIENKKAKIFIVIASLLLSFYSIFQVITDIATPKDYVLDFTNYDIKEVISWAKERDVILKQEFSYSDKIEEFHVISQDIKEGTPVRKVDTLTVIVSNGIDPTKKADVTNMVGWKLDDVIKFIDDNKLTNVTINFEFSTTVPKDTIISQNVIKEIKRNEPVTLVSSLGKESELGSVKLESLVGLDTFHALVYLGRNNLKYDLEYEYNDKEKEGTVLKQSIKKWTIISPNSHEVIVLTLAKQNEITVPDFTKMTEEEITEWAAKNRMRIDFIEEYHDTIKEGKVISSNYSKGSTVETGTIIEIKVSKGQIKMIDFIDIISFRKWAQEKDIMFTVEYKYSDTVPEGKLISSSHSKGQIIKESDTVNLIISQGGNTKIPNLIGLTKDEAVKACNKANIKCTISYLNDNTSYTKVVKQSMISGSTVPQDTSITVIIGE